MKNKVTAFENLVIIITVQFLFRYTCFYIKCTNIQGIVRKLCLNPSLTFEFWTWSEFPVTQTPSKPIRTLAFIIRTSIRSDRFLISRGLTNY